MDGTDYAVVPLLVQTEYPENGSTSEIILPDGVNPKMRRPPLTASMT